MREAEASVVVVDDDEAVRKSLGRLLKSAGYSVEVLASATELLQRAPYAGVGCLVLDVQLPDLNGLELQAVLMRNNCTLPMVFISGHADIPMSVRAMKAGAIDFITKPFSDEVLLKAIDQALLRCRQDREHHAEIARIKACLATLTPRESEVLLHVVSGQMNKQISADLGAAEKTIKIHRARVMEKMQADSLAALVRMAEKINLRPGEQPQA